MRIYKDYTVIFANLHILAMLLERQIILGSKENPLMVLEKYKLACKSLDFKKARRELLEHEQKRSETKSQWGYFPGFENDEEKFYPNCIRLASQLQKNFIKKLGAAAEKKLELAFIKVASKEQPDAFGGLHIDVDAGIKIVKEGYAAHGIEILRLLLNPHEHARVIEYSFLDKHRLRELGVEISDDQYKPIGLPELVQTEKIEIPPIEENAIHGLKFWSSLIPHVGATGSNGHFLISYGAYVNRKDVNYKL